MRLKLKLKSKILLLWFASIFLSLSVVTVLFVYLLNGFNEETARKKIHDAFGQLSAHMESEHALLSKNIRILGARKDVVASVALIETHRDVKNDQPLIFDPEKKNLVRILAAQARVSGMNLVSVYGGEGDLIAYFVSGGGNEGRTGFISYRNGKPVVFAGSQDGETFREEAELPDLLKEKPLVSLPSAKPSNGEMKVIYRAAPDGLMMEMFAPINRTLPNGVSTPVGTIRMVHFLGGGEVKTISRTIGMDLVISIPGTARMGVLSDLDPRNLDGAPLQKKNAAAEPTFQWVPHRDYYLGATRLPLQGGGTAFFIFDKEKGPLTAEISAFQKAALSGLVLAAFLVFSAGVFILNRMIVCPVNRLIEGVTALKNGRHEKIADFSETDELGLLAGSFNEMAETINERERELRKLSQAVEQSPASVVITDTEGKIEYVNSRFEQVMGYSRDEVAGKNSRIMKSGNTPPETYERLWETIASGGEWRGELLNKKKNGDLFWELVSIAPIRGPDGKITHFIGVKEDITERKQTEEALRESEERVRLLLENAADAIYGVDTNGDCTFCNPACLRALGYEKTEDLVGRNMHELIHHSHADGAPYAKEECRINSAFRNGKGVHVDDEVLWRADGASFPADYRSFPLRRDGEIVGAVVSFTDMTGRILTEERLRRSQKMDAIGHLTGGIAHDFNNILGIAIGFMELLEDHCKEGSQSRDYLAKAQSAAKRGAELTQRLLAFSRQSPYAASPLDINEVIAGMHGLIGKSLTPEIDVETDLAAGLWLADVNPGELEDALINLAINARDAMSGSGKLVIETENKTLGENDAPHIPAGEYVVLSVGDDGMGMAPEVAEKIFDPFFTTKEHGQGTGLGLSMVYGFAKRSGGGVNVASEPGAGTTFHIYFPKSHSMSFQTERVEENIHEVKGGGETILVVDDEQELADFAASSLSKKGYRVLTAHDAAGAMALIGEGEAIDLLFTDIVMPGGVNGLELAQWACERLPGLRVLTASGFTEKVRKGDDAGDLLGGMLHKPYRRAELLKKIRDVLDREI